jgi:hypothetical protein
MRFEWISEQTAITFLYTIKRLVFITEKESVYCAVRTGSLYIKQIRFIFKGLNMGRWKKSKEPTIPNVMLVIKILQNSDFLFSISDEVYHS